MKRNDLPSQQYPLECFDYSPETGDFTWRERPRHHFVSDKHHRIFNTRYAHTNCGCPTGQGYIRVTITDVDAGTPRPYLAHRLVWKLLTGEEPPEVLDHINGDRADNRACNLRPATTSQNLQNQKLGPRNTSGFKGVSWSAKYNKWRAQIGIEGRQLHLGYFTAPETAYAAYCITAARHFENFARTN